MACPPRDFRDVWATIMGREPQTVGVPVPRGVQPLILKENALRLLGMSKE